MSMELSVPVWVNKEEDFRHMAAVLLQVPAFALDTESNSLYVYREQVCLIQISIPGVDYLVDPLALKDLSALHAPLANPSIEKVFHAAEYDIICMKRDFGFSFANIFDTMLAAEILGWPDLGLGSILNQTFQVTLNKRYQRADWGQRPLPWDQLDYARLDSHYLLPLRDLMAEELKTNQRWELAQEDFQRLCRVEAGSNGNTQAEDCWKVAGNNHFTSRQMAILQALCQYRQEQAKTSNRPLFKVINNNTLVDIVKTLPENLSQLGQIQGMSKGQVARHGEGLLKALERGSQAAPLTRPRNHKPDESVTNRYEILRIWRKACAQKWNVDSNVILPKEIMAKIADKNPENHADLAGLMSETPWRLEHFGGEILKILKGREEA